VWEVDAFGKVVAAALRCCVECFGVSVDTGMMSSMSAFQCDLQFNSLYIHVSHDSIV
jgi:hypothetical protein